jgi:hypothetical protein
MPVTAGPLSVTKWRSNLFFVPLYTNFCYSRNRWFFSSLISLRDGNFYITDGVIQTVCTCPQIPAAYLPILLTSWFWDLGLIEPVEPFTSSHGTQLGNRFSWRNWSMGYYRSVMTIWKAGGRQWVTEQINIRFTVPCNQPNTIRIRWIKVTNDIPQFVNTFTWASKKFSICFLAM